MIQDVLVVPLRQIPDERGKIMHMLRADDDHFEKFGEIYFSVSYPGVIKGWHMHTRQTQNYAVVWGMIKLVLYDPRESSSTKGEVQELFIGEDNYSLVRIPPGIYNGYKAYGVKPALVANCATEPHDPAEMERFDPFDPRIPYDWELVHR
ncbi:dTDP-4-dehydrorhamnose 3,5-epimerase family protein [Acidobacteria bacterium AH-259-D05]|nr:dTDP-4-dehydrorhamnose 3,5-epimerase family protein [Acidobacteria bacterium AH-259-D05]